MDYNGARRGSAAFQTRGRHSPQPGPSVIQPKEWTQTRGCHSPQPGPSVIHSQEWTQTRGRHSPQPGPSVIQSQEWTQTRGRHSHQPGLSVIQSQEWTSQHEMGRPPNGNIYNMSVSNQSCAYRRSHSQAAPRHEYKQTPMSIRRLCQILELSQDEIVFELLWNKSGYRELIGLTDLDSCHVDLILKLIAKAVECTMITVKLQSLLQLTFQSAFRNTLLTSSEVKKSPEAVSNLYDICEYIMQKCSPSFIKEISPILEVYQASGTSDFQSKFGVLLESFNSIRVEVPTKKSQLRHIYSPPDDFRQLEILPTKEELTVPGRPFIRENYIDESYENLDDYLDVQFRLIKEDFCRPIRDGIANFLNKEKIRNHSFYVYKSVVAQSKELVTSEIVWKFEIRNLSQKVSHKRLMFGNVVCFSNDSFDFLIIGYIYHIDSKAPFNIYVKIEAGHERIKKEDKFVMLETKAYFETYRHVLKCLQMKKSIPFEDELLYRKHQPEIPRYLQGVWLNFSCLGMTQRVNATTPLINWPSNDELGLDESQRKSLHSTFTNRMTLIQGPPGTGKTFIGLKIVNILLDSIESKDFYPILVVSFTNHALDQFLEGIYKHTKLILRVGSRSKSEIMQKCSLKNVVRHFQRNRLFPQSVQTHDNEFELSQTRRKLQQVATQRELFADPSGILSLEVMEPFIPVGILSTILRDENESLSNWLMRPTANLNNDFEAPHQDEEWIENFGANENEANDRRLENDNYDQYDKNVDIEEFEITIEQVKESVANLKEIIDEFSTKPSDQYLSNKKFLEEKLKAKLEYLKMLEIGIKIEGINFQNVDESDWRNRWRMYNFWRQRAVDRLTKEYEKILTDNESLHAGLQEIRDAQNLHVMRNSKIVGMTTTGAARLSTLLEALAPKLVIIEEAAEVLEAQTICSISSKCEHLILIGDHEQLRPPTCVYDLAKNYHLDISMFERLIKNGHPHCTLSVQHRMRPEISELIVSSIYPYLQNHESVLDYPSIKGMVKNLFFMTHNNKEKSTKGTSSHENEFEAKFLMKICVYLRMQEYLPEQITILTAYMGQFFLLRKLQQQCKLCEGVRICTVDNFQGEENDIILLSLVRNNYESRMGFLSISNRVCVALSRAKHGLYVLGNIYQLQSKSALWRIINDVLTKSACIGSALPVQCVNHPEIKQNISHFNDFQELCPNGGCTLHCCFVYEKCGHACQRLCHTEDIKHVIFKCQNKCQKIICSLGHSCHKRCSEKCDPCKVIVKKVLPCEHTAKLECSASPNTHKCRRKVEKIVPQCQHINEMECCADPSNFICRVDCDSRLECGHGCRKLCHVENDPLHKEYFCEARCTRKPIGCSLNHVCYKRCGEQCDSCHKIVDKVALCGHIVRNIRCDEQPKCLKKCKKTLECGHRCGNKCYAQCGPCNVPVKKISADCGHEVRVPCHEKPTKKYCDKLCVLNLRCGHPCENKCKENCTAACSYLVKSMQKCLKHEKPCYEPCYRKGKVPVWELNYNCLETCGQELSCGHICSGKCGECYMGRLHSPCTEKCDRVLICGHVCKQPCSSNCPPCQELCELKCMHSKCIEKCSVHCIDCQEICERQCEHIKCSKKCSDICDKSGCDLPCSLKLKCGHDCVGFCGEVCPRLCRICDREKLTENILSGMEEEEDARFIELPNCKHVIEESALSHWLSLEEAEVGCKKCPLFRTPIYNLPRYKDEILKSTKDIRTITEKYYSQNVSATLDRVRITIETYRKELVTTDKLEPWRMVIEDGLNKISAKIPHHKKLKSKGAAKKVTDLEANVLMFQCDFLLKYQKMRKKVIFISKQLEFESERLLKTVINLPVRSAAHMQEEISCELQRLSLLGTIINVPARSQKGNNSYYQDLWLLMNTEKCTSENEAKICDLMKKCDQTVPISAEERMGIVKAIGLSKGHWFKCPNGHIYCIGECGGAMVTSKCPECNQKIGGTNHSLLPSNALAPEMDGANYAAWSDQANMGNYQFD